jgi:hypothetical protein
MRILHAHLLHERSYPREQEMHTDRGFQNQLEVYAALAADRKVERGKGCENLTRG